MATQNPSPAPTTCSTLSPTKDSLHSSAAPQEPELKQESLPLWRQTATAAPLYLHDDVESQIQQQITDEDPQYVGGEVSGPIHQPKDSTERERGEGTLASLFHCDRVHPKNDSHPLPHQTTGHSDIATASQLPRGNAPFASAPS